VTDEMYRVTDKTVDAIEEEDGLICAFALDGQGSRKRLDWTVVREWLPADGVLCIHLDRKEVHTSTWLREESGVDAVFTEALRR
jgi:zinc transporter